MLIVIRSIAFSIVMIIITVFFSSLAVLVKPFPFVVMSRILRLYARLVIDGLKYICGVRYEVSGREHIPKGPVIIFSKHQSTWETFALQVFFLKICFVAKRELFWIPFFGWGLAAMKPIAIDRRSRKQAAQQVVAQGKERLAEGISVVIFPEGTRTSPQRRGKYKIGGALLAAESGGCPIIPIAHNAGECWSRGGFIKRPGTIHVRIGPAIATAGKSPEQILAEAKTWIESVMPSISRNYSGPEPTQEDSGDRS